MRWAGMMVSACEWFGDIARGKNTTARGIRGVLCMNVNIAIHSAKG
jgi:hypothetical protein